MRILFPRLLFDFSGRFFRTVVGPLYLYLFDGPVLERLGSFVQYENGLNLNFPFGFYLYHRPINNMIRIIHIFL